MNNRGVDKYIDVVCETSPIANTILLKTRKIHFRNSKLNA